jgi:hypothetical protein
MTSKSPYISYEKILDMLLTKDYYGLSKASSFVDRELLKRDLAQKDIFN